MEKSNNSNPSSTNANNHNPTPTRRGIFKAAHSISRSISMSDTDSQTSHNDSFHSPLRSDSPVRSDDPAYNKSPNHHHYEFNPNSKAIVAYEMSSPIKETVGYAVTPPPAPPPPVMMFSRSVREGMHQGTEKLETGGGVGGGRGVAAEGEVGGGGERRSRSSAVGSILRRSKKEVMVKRAALGFRVCEVVLCLIAFAVMAADKTQGWSGDSFDRYTEYRYLVAVNVIGFVYSGFQTVDLAYYLIKENHIISHPLRYPFDFAIDQIIAYLLMSASSSAATRVIDWVSNWGKDEFTEMASASIGMSFLAFLAFALSSLISGYSLLIQD